MIDRSPITLLDGSAYEEGGKPLLLNVAIANVLYNGRTEDPLRANELALRIYGAESLELTESECEFVSKAVKAANGVPDGIRAQMLKAIG